MKPIIHIVDEYNWLSPIAREFVEETRMLADGYRVRYEPTPAEARKQKAKERQDWLQSINKRGRRF